MARRVDRMRRYLARTGPAYEAWQDGRPIKLAAPGVQRSRHHCDALCRHPIRSLGENR